MFLSICLYIVSDDENKDDQSINRMLCIWVQWKLPDIHIYIDFILEWWTCTSRCGRHHQGAWNTGVSVSWIKAIQSTFLDISLHTSDHVLLGFLRLLGCDRFDSIRSTLFKSRLSEPPTAKDYRNIPNAKFLQWWSRGCFVTLVGAQIPQIMERSLQRSRYRFTPP